MDRILYVAVYSIYISLLKCHATFVRSHAFVFRLQKRAIFTRAYDFSFSVIRGRDLLLRLCYAQAAARGRKGGRPRPGEGKTVRICASSGLCALSLSLSLSLSQPLPVRQTCLLRSSTSFVAVFSVVRVVRVICDRWMGEENYGRALN